MCALSSALKPVVLKTGVTTASVAHLVKKVAALKVVAQKAVQKADLKVAATAVLKVVSSLALTAVLPAAALATSLPVALIPICIKNSNNTAMISRRKNHGQNCKRHRAHRSRTQIVEIRAHCR
jgi:hypothetical protein